MNKLTRTFIFLLTFILLSAGNILAAPNAYISWKYVNLREVPKENAEIITKLAQGVSVTIVEEDNDWYKIKTEEDLLGWVVKRSLKVTRKLDLNKPENRESLKVKEPEKPAPKAEKKGDLVTLSEKSDNQKKGFKDSGKDTLKEEPIQESSEKAKKVESYMKAPAADVPEAPSLTGALIRMLSALFIILAIIIFLFYIAKKYFSKSILALEGGSAITVLASKYIGQKTILYIIDVMEKIIIVSVTGTEARMLTEISDPASIVRMRADIEMIKENEKPFKKFFSDKVKSKPAPKTTFREENFDILDELNQKLEKKVEDLKVDNDF